MVAGNDLSIRWGDALVIGGSLASIRDAVLLGRGCSSRLAGGGSRPRRALSTVVHAALGSRSLLGLDLVLVLLMMLLGALGALNVDVGNSAAIALGGRKGLVLVWRLRIFGNDIPGVDQAGDVTEDAEENVDDGVGATDSALDPDWQRREEQREEGEEDVGRTHIDDAAAEDLQRMACRVVSESIFLQRKENGGEGDVGFGVSA